MNSLIYILLLFLLLIYLLLLNDDTEYKRKIPKVKKEKQQKKNAYVYIITSKGFYICINENTGQLNLNKDKIQAELFKIVKRKRNKIGIFSTTLNTYLQINYTTFSNSEYDIRLNGYNLDNNATQITLSVSSRDKKNKKQNNYCIKFYNNHYLSNDKNGNVFGCRDKSKITRVKFTKKK